MNIARKSTRSLLGLLLAAAALTFASAPTQAQKGGGSFKAAAGIWTKVQAHMTMLDQTIKTKKLKDVHKHAFVVRDLVKKLPAASKGLSADKQANLAKGVRTVVSLAGQLDESGDAGKQVETEALHKKFDTVIKAIAGLYPAGALK